jgi:hypothetical protein
MLKGVVDTEPLGVKGLIDLHGHICYYEEKSKIKRDV